MTLSQPSLPPIREANDTLLDGQIETLLARARAVRDRGVLVLATGADSGRAFSIGSDVATLGRADACTIAFGDASLSRIHARVARTAEGFVVEDAGSRNGTFVNGSRVQRAVLADGDRVQLGSSTVLRFQMVDADEEKALRRLYESSVRDGLTGLFNRRHLDERIAAEIAYAQRHGTEVAVALLDIDRFKGVNDAHGHLGGDAVLRNVAAAVAACVRAEDIVARYGGEEIAIVTRGVALAGACQMAERIRAKIELATIVHEGRPIAVTASFGVAVLSALAVRTAESLLAQADANLYAAKHLGRNRVVG